MTLDFHAKTTNHKVLACDNKNHYKLRVMDTPGRFCPHFAKGGNFCRQEVTAFVYVFETFQKWKVNSSGADPG